MRAPNFRIARIVRADVAIIARIHDRDALSALAGAVQNAGLDVKAVGAIHAHALVGVAIGLEIGRTSSTIPRKLRLLHTSAGVSRQRAAEDKAVRRTRRCKHE